MAFVEHHAKRIASNELRAAETMLRLWEGRLAVAPRHTQAWKQAIKRIGNAQAKITAFTAASLCQHTWMPRPSGNDPYICTKCDLVVPYEEAKLRPMSNNFTKDK